jgi:histidyl-tRNA synthetase
MTTIALSHPLLRCTGLVAVVLAIIASAIPLAQRAVLTFMATKNLTHHAGAWSPLSRGEGKLAQLFSPLPRRGGTVRSSLGEGGRWVRSLIDHMRQLCPTGGRRLLPSLPKRMASLTSAAMTNTDKSSRPKARVAKGFRDITADEIRGTREMLATIQRVYESYGFEPVEQPFIEYTDALGKFLPDQDRPNAGVFSFQDDDNQWLSLRYDLTAPLARYVAENQQFLPTPFRSYRQGWVFRNEKPGPGRFRQFMQFDADTVGSSSPAADAEVCMMAADTMEALGIPRGQYIVKFNSRKLLDGVMQTLGLSGEENSARQLKVLRALDKFDRLRFDGVEQLLGEGRKDESGDFTPGAGLSNESIRAITKLLIRNDMGLSISLNNAESLDEISNTSFGANEAFNLAVTELRVISKLCADAGYSDSQIHFDTTVIRGLEYYTGPVFECELLMETNDEKGNPVRFGSVGGGGRYDDLVARFTGQKVPATGFSIGVSRLYAALQYLKKTKTSETLAPVVVTVMDKDRQGDYWRMVQEMRKAGIRAEMFVGTGNMGKQLKYADKRGSPLVIIQGGDEKARGEVQIKDLRLGEKLAATIESREEYASQRLAQWSCPESALVDDVRKALAR